MADVLDDVRRAALAFDWGAVDHAASDYVAELRARPVPPAKQEYAPVLGLLRGCRRYDAFTRVIDELLSAGITDPILRRHFGQAQIEQGYPAAALVTLSVIANDPAAQAEWPEARGSMGRCHKELYLRTTDADRRGKELALALSAYLGSYRADHNAYWSGINAVALLARADTEHAHLPDHPSPGEESRELAAGVLETVNALPADDEWAQATAVEALVAMGDLRGAAEQVERFIAADPSAFALNSLLRQLTEIWQLDVESPPGSTLLPQLRSELLRKSGGGVSLDPSEVGAARLERLSQSDQLEKVLGVDRYQTLNWYIKGLARCRAVARIETESEAGLATGFLVAGADLAPGLPEVVLMTNGHVVPERLNVDEAVVAFHAPAGNRQEPQRFRAVRQWWYRSSQYPELDTTLVELDGRPDDVVPVPIASRLPKLSASAAPRAYVIGHPRGLEQPQFSLQDNHILARNETRLHYRSPTEGGSSGSPVFDQHWNLIALHHAGSPTMRRLDGPGTYPANEGILASAILAALRSSPPARET